MKKKLEEKEIKKQKKLKILKSEKKIIKTLIKNNIITHKFQQEIAPKLIVNAQNLCKIKNGKTLFSKI